VLWIPGHPEDARIRSLGDLWGAPLGVGGIGLLCGLLGVVFLVRDRQAARPGRPGAA
jgi:hypothetical protein